jgi:DNA-binding transcriptional LysR family regulator
MAGPPYTLDQLGGFLAVVDEGSFSAAGRRLGRVQSAVSYGIAQLESALGTRLFDRRGHTPVLTDAGQRLAAEARLVLAQATELTECAARLHAGTEPSLRVVVDVAYPRAQLLAVCASFRAQFTATTLRLEVGLLGDAVDVVLRGDADLGACNLAGASPAELALTHLGTVAIVPVCAPDHPLAKLRAPQRRALLEQSVQIVLSERSGALTSDQGVLATRTWRVTDLAVKADLLRRGVGWGSLPLAFAEPWLASGELVRLEPEPWPREGHQVWIHAVVRKDRTLGRAGQWFRDQLRIEPVRSPSSTARRGGRRATPTTAPPRSGSSPSRRPR